MGVSVQVKALISYKGQSEVIRMTKYEMVCEILKPKTTAQINYAMWEAQRHSKKQIEELYKSYLKRNGEGR